MSTNHRCANPACEYKDGQNRPRGFRVLGFKVLGSGLRVVGVLGHWVHGLRDIKADLTASSLGDWIKLVGVKACKDWDSFLLARILAKGWSWFW